MGNISLLDCTLRDGGYINDWKFGKECIRTILSKLSSSGVEIIELGFLKEVDYDPNVSIFPNIESINDIIIKKEPSVLYVGMIDIKSAIPIEKIAVCDGKTLDGIRVIFKKEKLDEAFLYCQKIKDLGYKLFVNFVSTDAYDDIEFAEAVRRFNSLKPYCMAIVDTFGMMKKKQFKRLVEIADRNMLDDIALGYHAHNNLQQAMGNAEEMVEMNLKREVVIDACVFGMGRGAGNLNLELFAEFLNENYNKKYQISPILEIMDGYLSEIYHKRFWGYSLPLYMSATLGCHPNYAIYYEEKNTLTEKEFYEILKSISEKDKRDFSKETAELYYQRFFKNTVDDEQTICKLKEEFCGKRILVIAPGQSILKYENDILENVDTDTKVVLINFYDNRWKADYIFTSNVRRFSKIVENDVNCKMIVSSNVRGYKKADYMVNYMSYCSGEKEVSANASLMFLRLLIRLDVREVLIAGMDGYKNTNINNYFNDDFENTHILRKDNRNNLIAEELKVISKKLNFSFITPTRYKL